MEDLEDARLDADFLMPFYEHNAPYKLYVPAYASACVNASSQFPYITMGTEFHRISPNAWLRRLLIALPDLFR